ncbi:uncharacterized protein LOC135462063 [Liolophura sinensis]|uniref:uncharacterized protein LOC135462063 n=1 Tax=Liolophura sinensis TaxID=3198878 RepID=UPI0031581D57
MADSLYTSERLCKVITQNFREDIELKQRLRALEGKRRQALVRIILKTLEIERDIGPLLLPGVSKSAIRAYRRYNKRPADHSSSSGDSKKIVDRRAINEKSYQELIEYRFAQIRANTNNDPDSVTFLRTRSAFNSLRLPDIYSAKRMTESSEKQPIPEMTRGSQKFILAVASRSGQPRRAPQTGCTSSGFTNGRPTTVDFTRKLN